MEVSSSVFFRAVEYCAIALCALTLTGIATLMYIARDKDEDITGIVAPALLLTIVSTVVAIAAGVMAGRARVTENERHR
jgi:spore maturation protein SpmA